MIQEITVKFKEGQVIEDMQYKALEISQRYKCTVHFYVDNLHWVVFEHGKCQSFIMG